MYWDGSGFNSYHIKQAVQDCKDKIERLRWKFPLTKLEQQDLENTVKELEQFQEKCSHCFEKVTLATHVRAFCEYCQKEDTKYDFYNDPNPSSKNYVR